MSRPTRSAAPRSSPSGLERRSPDRSRARRQRRLEGLELLQLPILKGQVWRQQGFRDTDARNVVGSGKRLDVGRHGSARLDVVDKHFDLIAQDLVLEFNH